MKISHLSASYARLGRGAPVWSLMARPCEPHQPVAACHLHEARHVRALFGSADEECRAAASACRFLTRL